MDSSQGGFSVFDQEAHLAYLLFGQLLQRWTALPVCPGDCTLCDPLLLGGDALLCVVVDPIEIALLWIAARRLMRAVP